MGYESLCLVLEAIKSFWWLEFRFGLKRVGGEAGRINVGQVVKNLTYCHILEMYLGAPGRLSQ